MRFVQLVDRDLVCGITVRGATQRLQPNMSHFTVTCIIRILIRHTRFFSPAAWLGLMLPVMRIPGLTQTIFVGLF